MSARDEVLLWGLVDWVELDRIHRYVADEHPGEPTAIIQNHTLDLIRSLVSDGLFLVGDLNTDDRRFKQWNVSLDEAIQRIRDVYVVNFEDQGTWPWFCWLALTGAGQKAAEAIEARVGRADGR
jgi:hypothetical protein